MPESRIPLGIFDPHAAPARGFVVTLDVDKMLLNSGLAFDHIHLKGLHNPTGNIKIKEVPEADLHVDLDHPQVVSVN